MKITFIFLCIIAMQACSIDATQIHYHYVPDSGYNKQINKDQFFLFYDCSSQIPDELSMDELTGYIDEYSNKCATFMIEDEFSILKEVRGYTYQFHSLIEGNKILNLKEILQARVYLGGNRLLIQCLIFTKKNEDNQIDDYLFERLYTWNFSGKEVYYHPDFDYKYCSKDETIEFMKNFLKNIQDKYGFIETNYPIYE